MIAESISTFIEATRLLLDRKSDSKEAIRKRDEAVRLVMNAVLATKAYFYERDQGQPTDRNLERELSEKWQDAAIFIREYDYQLYDSAQLKALGWADPREWKRIESRPYAVDLDLIIEQCQWLLKNG